MNLFITVDTEADNQWQKGVRTLRNLEFLPRFHAICLKHGFTPTYLVTYEVADSQYAKMFKLWQDAGEAEIGAHLHPWTNPPISINDNEHRFPSQLLDDELKEKLETLTTKITANIGEPTSYRAGRWGFDKRQIPILSKLGYTIDCSITPHVNWAEDVDWSDAGESAHFIEYEGGKILELPMTILYPNFLRRLLNKPRWLRIFNNTELVHLTSLCDWALRKKFSHLEFMVHSSELMPGGSPYYQDTASVEHFFKVFESFLVFLKERGIMGTALSSWKVPENLPTLSI